MLAGGCLFAMHATAWASCNDLPNHAALTSALQTSVQVSSEPDNGGLNDHMWATLVDADGILCAVAKFRKTSASRS